jgi:hypothetical protein
VKRDKATDLLEDMLRRLDAGTEWPINLVDAVHLFGSYARGSENPDDVDVVLEFRRDQRMNDAVVASIFGGGNPYSPLKQALVGRRRGIQFQYEASAREQLEADGAQMVCLWRRGDTLDDALTALHAITPDPSAGRAPRHDMIDEFDGLDRVIPRRVRHDLITWRDEGRIKISRVTLPDQPMLTLDRDVAYEVDSRWTATSPLRRAALAALQHLDQQGADLSDVELSGYRLPTAARMAGHRTEPRWWITWKWQHYRAIPNCLADAGAQCWLEVPAPTRARDLSALVFTPGPRAALSADRP